MMSRQDIEATLAEADRTCTERSVRMTPIRRRILELVLEAGGPIKAYDILAQLGPGPGAAKPPTVYRALDFLLDAGLAHKIEALNAYVACAHAHHGGAAEFFICEGCGKVDERHEAAQAVSPPQGFHLTRSVVEHYGRCERCAA